MIFADHFPRAEMIYSETAVRNGIDNTPPPEVEEELAKTSHKAEEAREIVGSRMRVNSGFRCREVNILVTHNPDSSSVHPLGLAVDLYPLDCDLTEAFNKLTAHPTFMLDVDQLILEGGCIHIGRARPGQEPRRELRGDKMVGGVRRYPLLGIWKPSNGTNV